MTASFVVDLCLFVVVSSLSVFAWRHFGVVSLSCCRILSLLVFAKRLFVVISLTVQQEMLWRGCDNKPATCHLLTPRVYTCVLNVGIVSRVKDAHVFCQLSFPRSPKSKVATGNKCFICPLPSNRMEVNRLQYLPKLISRLCDRPDSGMRAVKGGNQIPERGPCHPCDHPRLNMQRLTKQD